MQPPSLHRYLYAYANPTVYTDPSGRIEELTAGAEMISSWSTWLRGLASRQSDDTAGHVVSGGVGIGRGLLGLTEGALRTANVAVNLYVVANAPPINDPRYHDATVDNAEHELQGTAHAMGQVMQFFDNGGAGKLYDNASSRLAQARNGDNASVSDVTSFGAALAAPTRVASMTAGEAASTLRTIAARATKTMMEGADGAPAAQFLDPAVVDELDEAYRSAGQAKEPAQVRVNQHEGARRESDALADLQMKHPGANIQQQVYLRTEDGKKAIDPITGEGRRLDFVVIKDGKVVDSVETTSINAKKGVQFEKEQRIREAGGTFVRDREKKCLLEACDVSTREDRRQ